MASELAMQRAAQAWCQEETKTIEMDVRLAQAFAEIIDNIVKTGEIFPNDLPGEVSPLQ